MNVGGWLGWIVALNPLTYGVAGLRHYLQYPDGVTGEAAAGLPGLGRLLDRFAGVRGRVVCGRLVDRRHALARRFAMSDTHANYAGIAAQAGSAAGPVRFCRT